MIKTRDWENPHISQDGRLPAEFEVTSCMRPGENRLAA
jgi:hypothetical protein